MFANYDQLCITYVQKWEEKNPSICAAFNTRGNHHPNLQCLKEKTNKQSKLKSTNEQIKTNITEQLQHAVPMNGKILEFWKSEIVANSILWLVHCYWVNSNREQIHRGTGVSTKIIGGTNFTCTHSPAKNLTTSQQHSVYHILFVHLHYFRHLKKHCFHLTGIYCLFLV